jgi:hypothetical protein|tara:strand:+ start:303 stop:524 length:222 start_codon:yes stop_codon:yes gene_type:complete
MIDIVDQIDHMLEAFTELKSLEEKITSKAFSKKYINSKDTKTIRSMLILIKKTKIPDIMILPDLFEELGIGEA